MSPPALGDTVVLLGWAGRTLPFARGKAEPPDLWIHPYLPSPSFLSLFFFVGCGQDTDFQFRVSYLYTDYPSRRMEPTSPLLNTQIHEKTVASFKCKATLLQCVMKSGWSSHPCCKQLVSPASYSLFGFVVLGQSDLPGFGEIWCPSISCCYPAQSWALSPGINPA